MKLEHSLTQYTKINSKWIKDLKARDYKVLRGKHRQKTLWQKWQQDFFFGSNTQNNTNKSENKQDLSKLKCTAKETINNMKRQPTKWKNTFANETMNKRLISKIYKQLMQLNIKDKQPNTNWAEDLNRHFSQEDIQMAKTHTKRCSTSLITRKIKNTVQYHLTQVRMANIKQSNKQYMLEKVEKGEPLYTVLGM